MTRVWRYAGGLVLAGVALAVVAGAVPLPDFEQPIAALSRSLGAWTYPLVAALAFLETAALVGLLVPGETAVVAGGVVAGRGGVDLVPLILLVWLAATAGDAASFLLGRRAGRRFLVAHVPHRRLVRVDRFYERHGGKAVLAARFVGMARSISPLLAGASGFPLRHFLPYSLAGTLAWAGLLTMVGYALAGSVAEAGMAATRIALGVALVFALVVALTGRFRSGRARAKR